MGRKRTRRQPHGSAWYWKQTGCWYYTPRGTEQRVSLFDEDGNRIRGPENKQAAQLALARIKLAGGGPPEAPPPGDDAWLVARVCSDGAPEPKVRARRRPATARGYGNRPNPLLAVARPRATPLRTA